MNLHTLPSSTAQKPQRVGRGGKRGTTAGRGQKGQKSRSGHKIRPASRDLLLRIPKRRGFGNKPTSMRECTISLATLSSHYTGKAHTITRDNVHHDGLVPVRWRGGIKIIGITKLSTAFTIAKGISVSAGAREAIERAGGTIVT